jgi:pilus assembly protein CpaF
MADVVFGDMRRLEDNLRKVVAAEVSEQQRRAHAEGRVLDVADQRQLARAVLQRELDLHSREALRQGELPLPEGEREDLAQRVLTLVFSPLPGLERYVERPDATNIHVMGSREVIVELLDGTTERHPSPYASDQEVIEAVAHIARRGGPVEREFNYSHPMLHLALADGSRLTANAWIGPEPYVTVRRHPLVDHDLDDLQALGMFDEGLRSLLGAAVRARWNLLIAGGQGNGKTTLLRALAHETRADERLLVLESEPELGLDRLPHRHNHVVTIGERPGNMAGDGAVALPDLVWHAKRLTPSRILVGEVLADEVVPMLEAMTQGVDGSMATIHAKSSAAVFPRLPIYARSRGQQWRSGDIYAQVAMAFDLVIFVARDSDDRRVVAEVRHIDRYDAQTDQIVSDAWFLPDHRTGRAVAASVIPVHLLDELVTHGYEPGRHTRVAGNGNRPRSGLR